MVAVVLFHADMPGVGGGFVGVDVFFVISGFLITGLLWREANTTGTVRLRRFYGARARRLLPASATVGVITMIASAVLLPPLQAPLVIDDGIASALYVSNYWFIAQQRRLLRRVQAAVAVPALLVVGRRGAVLPGVAGLDHRDGLAHPACAAAHQGRGRPPRNARIWWSWRWSRPCRSRCRWWSPMWRLLWRSFRCPPGPGSWPPAAWWPSPPASGADSRHGLPRSTGWAGLALILLACTRLSPATPYPGIAALLPVLGAALVIGAGCAAPSQGCGRALGSAADAGDRPGVLLVVSVALAGAGARSRRCWATRWAGRQLAAVLVSGGLAVLTLRFIENPLRFAAPIRRSALAQPRARRCRHRDSGLLWVWRCWHRCPPRSGAARRLRR